MNTQSNNFSRHQYRQKRRGTTYKMTSFLICICIVLSIISIILLQANGLFSIRSVFQMDKPKFMLSQDEENSVKHNEVDVSVNDDIIIKEPNINTKNSEAAKANESDLSTSDINDNADETAWCLILVNKWNELPSDYKVELIKLSNGECVDTRIYPMLQSMFDAARADGIYPIVASGYRTAQKQQEILNAKIEELKSSGYSNEDAETEAKYWVAVPGTSEHQLGLAVDINADGVHSYGTEVYKWLEKNAHLYGFINRYPADKKEITGVANEPWHYRYVGIEAATEIHKRGICLEEYLDKYGSNNNH